ncbi:MAG TPA: tetratricopeptide repeat protein [Gemmatimonadaceae bacterium]|nr:tetratricopeptide repeat protein [Gemmatimonadaceae bacterium]
MTRWLKTLAPVAFLATGACFATRTDIQVLQNDLAIMRAEAAERDIRQRYRIDSLLDVLATVNDSVRSANSRMARFQGDMREELYSLGQNLLTVQELTGQSQRRLQELRASMDQRSQEMQESMVQPVPGGDTSAAAGQPSPGPNQLLQLGLDQMRRGSQGAARRALDDLLRQYPTADIAPDAMYWIGESYAQERNQAMADSVYAAVVQRYPESARAATALYRRALIQRDRNNMAMTRTMLEEVVRRWPRSDEAELARDLLRTLR